MGVKDTGIGDEGTTDEVEDPEDVGEDFASETGEEFTRLKTRSSNTRLDITSFILLFCHKEMKNKRHTSSSVTTSSLNASLSVLFTFL